MVKIEFKELSEAYQQRVNLNQNIEKMCGDIQKNHKALDKYRVQVNHDGVTIKRKNKLDIIPTEELLKIESETNTQLLNINDQYYMFAWKFLLENTKKQEEKSSC